MAEDLRRLFEQGGDEEPVLTRRVAWGLAGTATKNSTWQTIVTWLQGGLNFLRPANNLSDVANPAIALSNLGGIGSAALTPYALKANVLELNNTVEFSPNNNYEPATKKYVDDLTVFKQATIDQKNPADNVLRVCCTWSRVGRVVTCCGMFYTDGANAPDGNTAPPDLGSSSGRAIVAIPPSLGITGIPAGVVAPAAALGERSSKIYLRQTGILAYLGDTAESVGYVFNFTFIMS